MVELATDAEAQAKADITRALTPSNLAALGASTTFAGLVELATAAEVLTGTDTARAPSVATMGSHQGVAKAWVNFNGTGTVAIRDSYNVTSITDNGTGDYTVNFAASMPSVNYVACGMCRPNTNGRATMEINTTVDPTASAFRFTTNAFSGIQTAADSSWVLLSFFGD
ncbi:hypothetical protein [Aminobacter sp. LjRoot7]|uniref:hypothetical protein n=1 Tax=Aminobacter sp. LjRoot7 TaxID=3342335 RepID=UPI003ECE770A